MATGEARQGKVERSHDRAILELLGDRATPLGAYEIMAALKDRGVDLVAVQTYRALRRLIADGLVHRLESQNAFLACDHGHGHDEPVALFICSACGQVAEVAVGDALATLTARNPDRGFVASRLIVEVEGRCGACP
jgi:Fur family zinc uptake transcriptional regulator